MVFECGGVASGIRDTRIARIQFFTPDHSTSTKSLHHLHAVSIVD
jgi:hypothetical protein